MRGPNGWRASCWPTLASHSQVNLKCRPFMHRLQQLGSEPLDEVLGRFVDTVNGAGTWRQTVSWFKEMVRANA